MIGFKLYAVIDSVHELPVAYEVTRASCGEQPQLREMLTKLKHQDAQMTARCEHFSADQGYDGNEVYDTIRETLKARLINNNRDLWRAEKKDGNYDPEQSILRLLNGCKARSSWERP